MERESKRTVLRELLRQALLLLFFGVILLFCYHCPIRWLTGVECPGCGLTRAFLAALRLDFSTAFSYHPLFLLIGIEGVYLFFRKLFHIPQKAEKWIGIFTLILMMLIWIIRM